MQTKSVQLQCNVFCKWDGNDTRYRLYVNDELFTERSWIWTNSYLEETHQILVPGGIYPIRYETLDRESGRIRVKNFRVIDGPGVVVVGSDEISLRVF